MKMNRHESIEFVDLPYATGTSIVVAQKVMNSFPRHVHESYCIGIVDSGERIIKDYKESYLVREKQVFVLNPGIPHQSKAADDRGQNYRVICIKPYVLENIVAQMLMQRGQRPFFPEIIIDDSKIYKNFYRFFYYILGEGPIQSETFFLSILTEIILRFSKNPPTVIKPGRQNHAVQEACDYIRSNYHQKITLAKLSKVARLHPIYFQNVFLKEKGITPNDYLSKIRLDKAKIMLTKGAGIAEVSIATGFTDQSHFTKFFNRNMGITPGKYLKSKLKLKRRSAKY